MRIDGHELGPDKAVFRIERLDGRTFELQMMALPDGTTERLAELLPAPPIKTLGFAQDGHGRLLRDPDTGRPVFETDEGSPEHRRARSLVDLRRTILSFAESLKADPTVHFESQPPVDDASSGAWEAYADALRQEFADAGFSSGDLQKMTRFLFRLCNVSQDTLDRARSDFT